MNGRSSGWGAVVAARLAVLPLLVMVWATAPARGESAAPPHEVAAKVDELLAEHWRERDIAPAEPCTDAEFLRRLTLDLLGRIPTAEELDRFLAAGESDKRARAVARLLADPEFPLYFAQVLDEMIQNERAGDTDFVDYLHRSLRERKRWDAMFREMMAGPWDSEPAKRADRFLAKRVKQPDVLTVDATRVFFGVDITCAQCHDHPLVADWSQAHFYGMMSFFHRTTGGKGQIGEKSEGEVTFVSGGEQKTAQVMFLSGEVIDPLASSNEGSKSPGKPGQTARTSRRAQLVEAALNDRVFFRRAIVNRLWGYFFGRGLVEPLDQMHSANPPSVPGVLEWLADDFADGGYDLHRLVQALVSTRAYQLSSRGKSDAPIPAAEHFAIASLRPLNPRQFAVAILQATGTVALSPTSESDRRIENATGIAGVSRIQQRLALDTTAESLSRHFDPRVSPFQSSASEALFLSNAPEVQPLFAAREGNLTARLAAIDDPATLVRTAVRAVWSRPPEEAEVSELAGWFSQQGTDRSRACERLVWALVGSAEFRFNH